MEKKLKTPALNILGSIKAKQEIQKGYKSLKENWENTEVHPRDPNCIIRYGVDKGETYGQVIQKDMKDYLELAKLKREIELNNPKNHDNNPFLPTFGLPMAIRMELEARGFPIDDMIKHNEFSEVNGIIEKEYPELKWTNVILRKK